MSMFSFVTTTARKYTDMIFGNMDEQSSRNTASPEPKPLDVLDDNLTYLPATTEDIKSRFDEDLDLTSDVNEMQRNLRYIREGRGVYADLNQNAEARSYVETRLREKMSLISEAYTDEELRADSDFYVTFRKMGLTLEKLERGNIREYQPSRLEMVA